MSGRSVSSFAFHELKQPTPGVRFFAVLEDGSALGQSPNNGREILQCSSTAYELHAAIPDGIGANPYCLMVGDILHVTVPEAAPGGSALWRLENGQIDEVARNINPLPNWFSDYMIWYTVGQTATGELTLYDGTNTTTADVYRQIYHGDMVSSLVAYEGSSRLAFKTELYATAPAVTLPRLCKSVYVMNFPAKWPSLPQNEADLNPYLNQAIQHQPQFNKADFFTFCGEDLYFSATDTTPSLYEQLLNKTYSYRAGYYRLTPEGRIQTLSEDTYEVPSGSPDRGFANFPNALIARSPGFVALQRIISRSPQSIHQPTEIVFWNNGVGRRVLGDGDVMNGPVRGVELAGQQYSRRMNSSGAFHLRVYDAAGDHDLIATPVWI